MILFCQLVLLLGAWRVITPRFLYFERRSHQGWLFSLVLDPPVRQQLFTSADSVDLATGSWVQWPNPKVQRCALEFFEESPVDFSTLTHGFRIICEHLKYGIWIIS